MFHLQEKIVGAQLRRNKFHLLFLRNEGEIGLNQRVCNVYVANTTLTNIYFNTYTYIIHNISALIKH